MLQSISDPVKWSNQKIQVIISRLENYSQSSFCYQRQGPRPAVWLFQFESKIFGLNFLALNVNRGV